MMKIILDTDVLTLIQQSRTLEYANLRARLRLAGASSICTTIVNFEEQTRGWLTIAASSKTD